MAADSRRATTLFSTPLGDYFLERFPTRRNEPLNAWCAADALLLEEAARLNASGDEILVVNDAHGALAVPLAARASWTDSWLSAQGLRHNQYRNQPNGDTQVIWSTQPAPTAPLILLRVPKQLAYFDYQLALLAKHMPANGVLLVAGMDKHLSPHTASRLEQFIGPTNRHPGARKARLFSARRDASLTPPNSNKTESYGCDVLGAQLTARPNVFSRNALDGGSRLLLEYLPQIGTKRHCIDVACGNGVLGLAALKLGVAQDIYLCDESALAVASARDNAESIFPEHSDRIHYHHGDGVTGLANIMKSGLADLIVCNPPFHMDHTVDDFAGRRLIEQCSGILQADGQLLLVANRHLNYRGALGRSFKQVEQVGSDARFNLLLARQPQRSVAPSNRSG